MSRELDKQVAEKVFSLEIHPELWPCKTDIESGAWIAAPEGYGDDEDTLDYVTVTDCYIGLVAHPIPHYSTNIADAWRVVDEMINKHNLSKFSIDSIIPNSDPIYWAVFMNDESASGCDFAETICRAALEAVKE